ncbi:uncharacterized protein LOC135387782 isoform X2 [Ornithodoros turicata]|uniref:uncharacterized protein LOC135387782 isoform X2 n=1 Tax=Ornithodoros turicata TaxID=34597 RepID=UPI003139AC4F
MATDFDIKLAQMVEKYPAIHDIMNANYHKKDAKKQAWADISKQLEAKCEIKWKSLKHQYLKRKKEADAAWPLMEFLKFLDEGKTKGRKSKAGQTEGPRPQDVRTTVSPEKPSPRAKRARRESVWRPKTEEKKETLPPFHKEVVIVLTDVARNQDKEKPPADDDPPETMDCTNGHSVSATGTKTPTKTEVRKGRKRLISPTEVVQEDILQATKKESEESFEKLLSRKLAQVSPAILGTIKASILELVNEAAKQ